jgi:hypothetical protein
MSSLSLPREGQHDKASGAAFAPIESRIDAMKKQKPKTQTDFRALCEQACEAITKLM